MLRGTQLCVEINECVCSADNMKKLKSRYKRMHLQQQSNVLENNELFTNTDES